jgi:hypothetical protein
MGWYKLASHLGQPLQFVKQWTTYSEFEEWMVYLGDEECRTTKQDLYLAQIAQRILQMAGNSTSLVSQLLPFGKEPKKVTGIKDPVVNKAIWLAWAKIGKTE